MRTVHDELKTQGIKLTIKDEALRKRIRPHRQHAEFVAKHGGDMDEEVPF